MTTEFEEIRVLDNFYQTSSFYPMPVVLITTISETGAVNIGPYSLVFPFGIAGKHAMMLISRNTSNTAVNITKTKKAVLNFIPYNKKYLKNTVRLGFPGQTAEEKLEESMFTLVPNENGYPDHIDEAIQVFECYWDDGEDFHYNGHEDESHFLLRINRVLLKKKWKNSIIEGNKGGKGKGFPSLPIDYGYRDNQYFWFCEHSIPYSEALPTGKGVDIGTVRYQADRLDPEIYWTDEACEKIVAIPKVFLKKAMTQMNEIAKELGHKTITPEVLDIIRDKRNQEKRK